MHICISCSLHANLLTAEAQRPKNAVERATRQVEVDDVGLVTPSTPVKGFW